MRPGKLVNRKRSAQILSPGTHLDERIACSSLERNNFRRRRLSLWAWQKSALGRTSGLALVDLTTGDFLKQRGLTELENDAALLAELERLRPAEIIFPTEAVELRELLRGAFQILSGYDDWTFAPETALFTVREHFKVASLDGFGLKEKNAAIGAAGGALHYLAQKIFAATSRASHAHLVLSAQRLSYARLHHASPPRDPSNRSIIDAPRNARLSLYAARWKPQPPRRWAPCDCCVNGFRNRSPPLNPSAAVRKPCNSSSRTPLASTAFASSSPTSATSNAPSAASGHSGSGNARDLVALRVALEQIPALKQTLTSIEQGGRPDLLADADGDAQPQPPTLLPDLSRQISELPDIVESSFNAPSRMNRRAAHQGRCSMIRDGFDAGPRRTAQRPQRGGKDWIAKLQADEDI